MRKLRAALAVAALAAVALIIPASAHAAPIHATGDPVVQTVVKTTADPIASTLVMGWGGF